MGSSELWICDYCERRKGFTTEYTKLKEFTEIVSQDCANFIDH